MSGFASHVTLATLIPVRVGQIISAGASEPRRSEDKSAEWGFLIDRLNRSRFLAEAYPELVEQPEGVRRWADEFNFIACFAATRNNRSVAVGYWTMHGDGAERLAQRLGRDAVFTDDLARGCFGISGEELRATIKPIMADAISEPGKSIFTPGGGWATSDAIYHLPDPPAATASS